MATTLTSKEQVTIPKSIRELLGLQAGSAVDFQVTEEGQVLVVPTDGNRFRWLSFCFSQYESGGHEIHWTPGLSPVRPGGGDARLAPIRSVR